MPLTFRAVHQRSGLLLLGFALSCGLPAGSEPPLTSTVQPANPRCGQSVPPSAGQPEPRPRNLILILGDGLGYPQVQAAREELREPDEPLFFERFPVHRRQLTRTADGKVTDSAAAATALSTGVPSLRGHVGVDPQGRPRRTLAQAALARGMAVGLITTTAILDATPAAFAAHARTRRDRATIAKGMAATGPELLVGAPTRDLAAGVENGLLDHFVNAGYRVERSMGSLLRAPSGRLLGLLPMAHLTANPEQGPRSTATSQVSAVDKHEPALASLSRWALRRLADDPDGFLLLVEDEEPDSGGHRRDWPRAREGVRRLEAVAVVAAEYAERLGNTLVVLSSDHQTGTLAGRKGQRVYTTDRHTADPVPIYACGTGSELLLQATGEAATPRARSGEGSAGSGTQKELREEPLTDLSNAELGRWLAQVMDLEIGATPSGRLP